MEVASIFDFNGNKKAGPLLTLLSLFLDAFVIN